MSRSAAFLRRRRTILDSLSRRREQIRTGLIVLLTASFSAYLGLAVYISVEDSVALLVLSSLVAAGAAYRLIKTRYGRLFVQCRHLVADLRRKPCWKYVRWTTYGSIAVAVVLFLFIDVARHNPRNLISISGFSFYVLISVFYSKSPADIQWRTVFCGTALQLVIGLIVLRWEAGRKAIEWIAHYISVFVHFGRAGPRVLFGEAFTEHSFAMEVLPMFTWFNAVVNTLLYLGVMQLISKLVGDILRFFVAGTSAAEAFVAAAGIFLGPETPILMIRPMVPMLSAPELFTLMTCGLATIDVGLIPMFESFGVPAKHLLAASCMSAPAALMVSKVLFPNSEENHHEEQKLKLEKTKARNIVNAFVNGAEESVSIIASLIAYLMTAVSLMEFVNTNLTWFGHRAGIEELTLQLIMSYVLTPVAFLMGVNWDDCYEVASLMGTKTIINEFVAYTELAALIYNRENGLEPSISPRSEVIAAYALCGFSNFGTVGMIIGFMASLIPDKIGCITKMSMKSLVGGSIACFMTGCVAAHTSSTWGAYNACSRVGATRYKHLSFLVALLFASVQSLGNTDAVRVVLSDNLIEVMHTNIASVYRFNNNMEPSSCQHQV